MKVVLPLHWPHANIVVVHYLQMQKCERDSLQQVNRFKVVYVIYRMNTHLTLHTSLLFALEHSKYFGSFSIANKVAFIFYVLLIFPEKYDAHKPQIVNCPIIRFANQII